MRSAKNLLKLALSVGLLLGAVAPVRAQSTDELVSKLVTYKLGQDRKPLEALQGQVIKAATNPAQRAELAKKLAAMLTNADATYEAKDFACRQLYLIATEAEIPALASLLGDEQLSHMSRYVLERMEEPAAGAALREALNTTKGKLLVGVINSVGNRRDAAAMTQLRQMLDNPDAGVVAAIYAALGRIGGPAAVATLKAAMPSATGDLKNVVIDAYLKCADELLAAGKNADAAAMYHELYAPTEPTRIRMAALRGLVAAEPAKSVSLVVDLLKSEKPQMQAVACGYIARQLPGQEATNTFVSVMNGLSTDTQVLLLDALGVRGDASAKAAVLASAKSANEAVSVAAIKALATLGNASDVKLLAETAAGTGPASEAARSALARLHGQEVDPAILAAIKSSSENVQVQLVRALASRGATSAVPAFLDLAANGPSESVRLAALEATGSLAAEKDYSAVVKRIVEAKSDTERKAATTAAAAVATRFASKDASAEPVIAALANASTPAKVALLGNLNRIGGDKALVAVRNLQKDSDASLQEAAVRAIASWPEAAAIPDMMNIVQTGNDTQRVLALRGLQKVIPASGKSAADSLALYRQMLAACKTADEKRVVLAGAAEVKDTAAFELVLPSLSDDALRNEAATAAIKIAKAVGPANPQSKVALQKVLAANIDAGLKKQAQEALGK
ncbi:MAG: HEAT repeat domain-containing protein [Bacillota bacterium]